MSVSRSWVHSELYSSRLPLFTGIVLLALTVLIGIPDAWANDNGDCSAAWTELTRERDRNTRVWEVTRWKEFTDSVTGETSSTPLRSKVVEKGCGICYQDSDGRYQISEIEWREAAAGFVIDRANYELSIGKTAGDVLQYIVEGETLRLRPERIEAVSGAEEASASRTA